MTPPNDTATEAEIVEKGLTKGPRVTLADIEATIAHEFFMNGAEAARVFCTTIPREGQFPADAQSLGVLTICVLVLKNGYTILGKSACVSPVNFDQAFGEKLAREDAIHQIWALEGYRLRSLAL